MSCTLVGASMDLMAYTLYVRVLKMYLLTYKPRYSVLVHLNNIFSVFNLNTASVSFGMTFSGDLRWSAKSF